MALDNVFLRFESASTSEGDIIGGSLGNRYFGSFYRALFDTQNNTSQEIPFLGFGLGIGTKVGEQILGIHTAGHTFAFAEEEVEPAGWKILEITYDLHNDEKMVEGNIMTEYEKKFSQLGNKINMMQYFPPKSN